MKFPCDLLSASVVVLVAVGELNTLSGKSGLAGTVGVASVKKSCHEVPRRNPGPRSVAWLDCALRVQGERR